MLSYKMPPEPFKMTCASRSRDCAVYLPRQWCRVAKSHCQILKPVIYVFRPNTPDHVSAT